MSNVPVYCNLLWSESQLAIDCPKGDIKLAFCRSCNFITNIAFEEVKLDYSQQYENSLHYSPKFEQYARSIATDLVKRHRVNNKDVIEIGCGKGDFLVSICELGNNRGVGFDPSYIPRSEHTRLGERVRFIQDFYSEKYRDYQADSIVCRHTLEHLPNPIRLLEFVRQTIDHWPKRSDRSFPIIFFEVPNALHAFARLAVWDIIYEHCCYFTPCSLVRAFSRTGFDVIELNETFEGQFICLEALPSSRERTGTRARLEPIENLSDKIYIFANEFNALVTTWQQELTRIARLGKKVVVWGAGSKGVTFLNLLKNYSKIQYVVDLNPRKQGMYVPGGGQKIVAPEFLRDYQPDIVIIANSIYEIEIRQFVMNLGLNPEFICI